MRLLGLDIRRPRHASGNRGPLHAGVMDCTYGDGIAPPRHRCLEQGQPLHGELPPLIRGYLRARVRTCGEPTWDPEFGTAEFPMLIAVDNVNRRFARHFDLSPDQSA